VSDHFEFRVISGWVGIGSSSVGSIRVLDRIRLDQVGYRVILCWVISGFGSYQVGLGIRSSLSVSFRVSDHIRSDIFIILSLIIMINLYLWTNGLTN
jgi:hypothetical protein